MTKITTEILYQDALNLVRRYEYRAARYAARCAGQDDPQVPHVIRNNQGQVIEVGMRVLVPFKPGWSTGYIGTVVEIRDGYDIICKNSFKVFVGNYQYVRPVDEDDNLFV